MTKTTRLTEIDALRGIAALSVCLFHFSLYTNNNGLFSFTLLRYGATGVDLFFMISGFVILLSLETTADQKEFWFARFKRIMPAYWLSIIVALAIDYFCDPVGFRSFFHWNRLAGNLLMLQPLFRSGELVGVYWTLYVELWFYGLVSIIWLLGWMRYIERIIWFGLAITALVNALYLYSPSHFAAFIPLRAQFPMLTCFSYFASGIIFYPVYAAGWSRKRAKLLVACFFMVGLTQFTGGHFNAYLSLPGRLLCNAIFYIFFFLVISKRAVFLNMRWLLFLGSVSYALYLFHDSFGRYLLLYLAKRVDTDAAVLISLLASVLVAALVTYVFEKPLRKWLAGKFNA